MHGNLAYVPCRHGEQAGTGCLAQVLVFGSFWSGLYHKGSDLDLTITGRWRNRHGQLLDMVGAGTHMASCLPERTTAAQLHVPTCFPKQHATIQCACTMCTVYDEGKDPG